MALLRRLLVAGLALLLWAPCAHARDLQLTEQRIKAALLYNFLKYTQWPAERGDASQTLTVCVFGEDPFSGDLHAIATRTVNQHNIALRFVKTASETPGCHLLFINEQEASSWQGLRTSLAGKSVLTVSDMEGFARQGGMIELGWKDNRIHVSCNLGAVEAVNLSLQDRLLKLVHVIYSEGH